MELENDVFMREQGKQAIATFSKMECSEYKMGLCPTT